ncbi:hypothetical protein G6F35_018192 [Rhizopus arrhizus]|nr:hypothetical protein G6F35_018192 [Rhizopus arrhizus]
MEDAGGQHGAGAAGGDAVGQMLQVADAAGGDDGYRHGIRHGAGQLQVEARLGAAAMRRAQATASSPVALRPPCVKTSQRAGSPAADTRRASMATTTHCEPW